MESEPDRLHCLRRLAKSDLFFFAYAVLGHNLLTKSLHIPLCRFLEGPGTRKLIALPRGYYKTTVTSVDYVLWRIIRNPEIRVLVVFNTTANAMKTVQELRGIVETNTMFRALFPEVLPDLSSKRTVWSNTALTFKRDRSFREATVEAAGVETDLTSRHYNLIIEDDPIAAKRDDMGRESLVPNPEDIAKGIGLHRMLGYMQIPQDRELPFTRILVGTRWTSEDLIQWVLDNEPEYEAFVRSAEGANGESAYPEMYTTEELRRKRDVEMGPYLYSSQMCLKPVPVELQAFRPEWLELTWDSMPKPEQMGKANIYQYILIDPNHKADGSGSKTGIVPIHVLAGGQINILPCIQRRCEPNEIVKIVLTLVDRMAYEDNGVWYTPKVMIEDVGAQWTFRDYFREAMRPDRPFQVITDHPRNRQSKDERIRGLTIWFSAGRFRFPTYSHDLLVPDVGLVRCDAEPLRKQLLNFGFTADKDLADALSYVPQVIDVPYDETKVVKPDPFSAKAIMAELDALWDEEHGGGEMPPSIGFWRDWDRRGRPVHVG